MTTREIVGERIRELLPIYDVHVDFEEDEAAGMVAVIVSDGLMNVRAGWLALSLDNQPDFIAWCMVEAWRAKYGPS